MAVRTVMNCVAVAVVAAACTMATGQAYGGFLNPSQIGSAQSWSDASIWANAHNSGAYGNVPQTTDGVYLSDPWAGGTAATVTLNLNASAEIASLDVAQNWVSVGVTRTGVLNLLSGANLTINTNQAVGTYWSNRLTIGNGDAGNGILNQYAGSTLTVNCTGVPGLYVAKEAGSTGTYNMYGGTLTLTTGSIYMDANTTGSFEFNAGVIYLPGDQTSFAASNSWFHANGVGYTETYNAGADSTMLHYVPEPSSMILLGVGLVGLLAYAWRKRK